MGVGRLVRVVAFAAVVSLSLQFVPVDLGLPLSMRRDE